MLKQAGVAVERLRAERAVIAKCDTNRIGTGRLVPDRQWLARHRVRTPGSKYALTRPVPFATTSCCTMGSLAQAWCGPRTIAASMPKSGGFSLQDMVVAGHLPVNHRHLCSCSDAAPGLASVSVAETLRAAAGADAALLKWVLLVARSDHDNRDERAEGVPDALLVQGVMRLSVLERPSSEPTTPPRAVTLLRRPPAVPLFRWVRPSLRAVFPWALPSLDGRRATVVTAHIARWRRTFTHADLAAATRNFLEKLGGGGFGDVYLGCLPSGTQIAVKVLTQDPALGDAAGLPSSEQLAVEANVSEVSHPNIVPLLGLAVDGPQPCLVYAHMEGGALDDRLKRANGRRALTANERILVLSDIARGLAYLHACQGHPQRRQVRQRLA